MPLTIEEELFRIALEALNNVIKHASAQQVTVSVQFERECVCLTIQDDGVGFDPVAAIRSGGRGLLGIQERAERVHGTFAVDSAGGNGTTLKITIPNAESESLNL